MNENKNEKFDPKTLKAFDKVLVRDGFACWTNDFFSYIDVFDNERSFFTMCGFYKQCIPYNKDTKHLLGTTDEAPEFYRYWTEDWV